jgi:hypothetical protein
MVRVRSHRLTVRTPGFHPGNPGSIPGEITKKNAAASAGAFFFAEFIRCNRTRRRSGAAFACELSRQDDRTNTLVFILF